VNAEYLQTRGAAILLEDGNLNDEHNGLTAQVSRLLNDTARLNEMRQAALGLARRGGAM
jgi:UDP-N-acetylglucosamine:LPS N-acetylglucosamine transferase